MQETWTPGRRRVLLWAPLVLLGTMYLVFRGATAWLGERAGYSTAFAVYWVVWGLMVPFAFVGRAGLEKMFARVPEPLGQPKWVNAVFLVLPVIGGFATAFVPQLASAGLLVVLVALLRALANASAEEVFWRGLFLEAFPTRAVAGWLYPALVFGAWHLIPLRFVATGSSGMFLAGAFFIGITGGWIAWLTGSIRWTLTAHVLTDAMGLAAARYVLGA